MTARGLVDRRFRAVMRVVYLGGALFLGALAANKIFGMPDWVWVTGLFGFAVAWLTLAGAWVIGFRCSACGRKLTALLMQRGGFRMDPRIRFCPYYGQGLDADDFGSTDIA